MGEVGGTDRARSGSTKWTSFTIVFDTIVTGGRGRFGAIQTRSNSRDLDRCGTNTQSFLLKTHKQRLSRHSKRSDFLIWPHEIEKGDKCSTVRLTGTA